MEICGAAGCSAWLDAPCSTRKRACLSSLRQSFAHNVSKILAAGFGRFNNFPKIVPAHCKQFHISLGANRSVATCFSQEPNLPKVIARMKDRSYFLATIAFTPYDLYFSTADNVEAVGC